MDEDLTMTQQVTYTGIASNKGRPRLWIEGVKLAVAGFSKGLRYNAIRQNNELVLELDENGSNKVSGRTRHGKTIPIIDLNLSLLFDLFGKHARVRVVFTINKITISLHHEQCAKQEREAQIIRNLRSGKLKEASICTGGGISTTAIHDGLHDAGIEGQLCWVVDTQLTYLQAAAKNSWAITDATSFYVGRVEEIETNYFSNVDILSFSLSCSGPSRAGRAKHKLAPEEHDGATALFGTVNAIKTSNPAIILSENVIEAKGSPMYLLLISELKRLGYRVLERVLDRDDTGTFENRERYWFIAVSDGLADGLSFNMGQVKRQSKIVSDFLEKDVQEHKWSHNQYLNEKAIRDADAGKGFKRQLLWGQESKIGTIGRHYAKKRSTEPFLVREDGKERLFTKIEHARFKSIPEQLIDGVSNTTAHQILGQSIDYLQAYLPIKSLVEQLKEKLSLQLSVA